MNLGAVTAFAASHGEDVAVFCAGVKGTFALDDAPPGASARAAGEAALESGGPIVIMTRQ